MTESERLGRAERIDRSRARAWLLQIHYRWESAAFGGSLRDALVDTTATRRISPRRLPYIRSVLCLLEEHIEEIDALVTRALDNWTLERVSKIDRAILRIGATEILYFDDVPPKVSWRCASAPPACGFCRSSQFTTRTRIGAGPFTIIYLRAS